MNKLNFSISLREKGFSKNEMINKMEQNGFDQSEIQFYLKKSDKIYLDRIIKRKRSKKSAKSSRLFKTITLLITLVLLAGVFFGYASVGIIGLLIFWSLVKFGSYRS
jgi:fatty-acid desaturase